MPDSYFLSSFDENPCGWWGLLHPPNHLIFDANAEASNKNNVVKAQLKPKAKERKWNTQTMHQLNVWNQGVRAFDTESRETATAPVDSGKTFSPWIVASFGSLRLLMSQVGDAALSLRAAKCVWVIPGAGTTQGLAWSPGLSLTHGESGDRSGCLLTSSFMGTLVSAFLSAESGRKVGQNACGVQLRERKKKKKQELELGEQTPHEAERATAKWSPEGLLGAFHAVL